MTDAYEDDELATVTAPPASVAEPDEDPAPADRGSDRERFPTVYTTADGREVYLDEKVVYRFRNPA